MITKLVDRMIGQEILESEKRDEYIYALTIRAEQVITYTLLAMVCLWTHNILEGLIYAVAFKGIRQYSGGYHAKTLLGCLVGTIAMLLAVVRWIAPFLQTHPIVMIFLVIISICVLFIFSPVNHPNLNLSKEENPVMKLTGKIVKRDVRVIEQGWPPMCVGFLYQPVRPQSLQHKDVTKK